MFDSQLFLFRTITSYKFSIKLNSIWSRHVFSESTLLCSYTLALVIVQRNTLVTLNFLGTWSQVFSQKNVLECHARYLVWICRWQWKHESNANYKKLLTKPFRVWHCENDRGMLCVLILTGKKRVTYP